ncbi:DUF2066 domain-containing protein [uncultured Paraglaciecola sp.]|uniref:DUF2066 domain-containing protein n=1 Tax=uncultured Paraglaciecola sp. TaxID=1765024 RepID=UPI00260CBEE9|nr:DUF2066 domain-containing protein [uncultured Paraglaciecola sp.]
MPINLKPVVLMLLLVWLNGWQSVKAAVIEDLYEARIAVDNQSKQAQVKAFSLAFKQVLLKVRGNSDLLNDQKITSTLPKATRFVRAYSYDRQGSQLYLVISFDPNPVQNLIRSAGFPVWDKRRPDSILWLAIQTTDALSRQIVTASQYPEIYQQMRSSAAHRGLSLTLPLWDLGDVESLGVYDIWGEFNNQILQASERYAASSVLSARIYQKNALITDVATPENTATSQIWLADWLLMEGGDILTGQVQGDNPTLIAKALVDGLADQLSSKYAIDLSKVDRANSKIQIVINNMDSLNYYTQASSFLANMSIVNDATLVKQQGPRATFELDLLGDVEDLNNAFRLDNKIRPVVDDFGQRISDLEFFWVK